MRKLAIALTLTLTLGATAPAYCAPRFNRDTDPIARFIKFVKKTFGLSNHDTIQIPIPDRP